MTDKIGPTDNTSSWTYEQSKITNTDGYEIDELRADVERLKAINSEYDERYIRLLDDVERLNAAHIDANTEAERLRAALKRFGKHALSCVMRPGDGCICGLDDVLGEKTLPDESY